MIEWAILLQYILWTTWWLLRKIAFIYTFPTDLQGTAQKVASNETQSQKYFKMNIHIHYIHIYEVIQTWTDPPYKLTGALFLLVSLWLWHYYRKNNNVSLVLSLTKTVGEVDVYVTVTFTLCIIPGLDSTVWRVLYVWHSWIK